MQRPLPERAADFERRARFDQLRAGAAETDITPAASQWLAGYGLARASTGVHSPLKARAFVLIAGDLKLAIVGLDNLGLQRDDADWIKSGVYGFANGCVLLCSSHTHAAPDLVGLWGWYLLSSGRDRDYLALVRRRVAEAVAAAEAAALPARLRIGSARLPPRGLVRNANYKELIDPRVTVLQALALEGERPLGAILHLACHPEVLRRGNTLLSSDFVGDLCQRWREAGLGQPVFVNGALGAMVTPDGSPKEKEGIPRVGGGIFEVCRQALAAARDLEARDAVVRRRDVYLPLVSNYLRLGRLLLDIPREAYDGCARTTVGYLRLGDVEIACVPGEIEPGFAERIRRRARRPDLLVFGLVDDEVGYLLSGADAHDRWFAYERSMSPGPDAGEQVFAALVGVVRAD
jgi:hypothetical protein